MLRAILISGQDTKMTKRKMAFEIVEEILNRAGLLYPTNFACECDRISLLARLLARLDDEETLRERRTGPLPDRLLGTAGRIDVIGRSEQDLLDD